MANFWQNVLFKIIKALRLAEKMRMGGGNILGNAQTQLRILSTAQFLQEGFQTLEIEFQAELN
ncbi:hypothetical protein COW20_15115 [bacterium (Candidatus Blackallbacteria) CG13_big_fil_rev_8_21_14_2_50_49_14]|nr:MAG: hypothetical protein COW64_16475 [bacterium (Candidatus Blackallbacteria) CG18_big_fil_WC_8_21_14_2_50_49_26]PIW46667.1 MAG: hypothetical protein COW20_15115 [bacterium (Candidatus Blackallbacteria) CG13_big_fil_rev_8_21_14_2_50_49_14]